MNDFTTSSTPRPVLRATLATRLRDFRLQRDDSSEVVATRFADWLRRQQIVSHLPPSELVALFQRGGIERIEEVSSGSIHLSYQDCELLAESYGIHRILIDPVLSLPSDSVCIVEPLDRFFNVGDVGASQYGFKATYRTPDFSLKGADSTALVRLTLFPGGYSDTHSHPGDELMLVLDGSVDVLLLNSGLRARLTRGDLIHFHAEQAHCAVNVSQNNAPAELLIVRLRRSRRRQNLIAALQGRLPRENENCRTWSPAILAAWHDFHVTVNPGILTSLRERQPFEIPDRVGLGLFLQRIADEGFRPGQGRLSLVQLAKRARGHITRARFDRIHHGKSPVRVDELRLLAEIYEIAPVLLYDFVMPVIRPAIAVRCQSGGSDVAAPLRDSDLWPLPKSFLEESHSEYRIPCRRLADSNVAIAWLAIPKDGETPENRHPGHELLVPFSGEFRLTTGTMGTTISADRNEFAHFDSSRLHSVSNAGTSIAEAFVLRVYE